MNAVWSVRLRMGRAVISLLTQKSAVAVAEALQILQPQFVQEAQHGIGQLDRIDAFLCRCDQCCITTNDGSKVLQNLFMLASFAINLFFAKPNLLEMAQGIILLII